jgi:hypothetical protein
VSTEKIKGGYVLLARKIIESELMNKPPHYLKLWVWMLGSAFWKDGDSLKRGQLLTTIAAMQEAGGYYVGARKKILTRDEVRSCYEAFSKASMITTAKTTRGMVITINNFDTYQSFSSYEGHGEPHGENRSKAIGTPHDRENIDKAEENKKPLSPPAEDVVPVEPVEIVHSFSEPVMWISNELARLVLLNNPKNRELQSAKIDATVLRWAKDIDKMIRLDKREPREIAEVVRWCQKDSFWSQNILSGLKLREQYDKLILKMKGTVLAVVPTKPAKETRLDRNIQAGIEAGRILGVFDGEE